MALEKKTILVTGGSGYIGSHVVRYLLENNFNIINIDNLIFQHDANIDLNKNSNYKFYNLDIRDINSVKKKINKIDHVVHLAALVGEKACKRDENETMSVNYNATIELANLSLESLTDVLFENNDSASSKNKIQSLFSAMLKILAKFFSVSPTYLETTWDKSTL